MGLQYNPHIFFAHLPSVIQRIKSITEGLLTFGTEVALAPFTRQAMLMWFIMIA
jgi:hypothetical protein